MLSKYCFDIANEYETKIGGVNKLLPNLGGKNKYVVNYKNLYLSLGMKLTKVHSFEFKQSDWLKNTLILIQTKEKMQLIVLKNIFLN